MEQGLNRILRNYQRGIITAEECHHQIRNHFLWKFRTEDNSTVTKRGWKEAEKRTNLVRRLIGLKKHDIIFAMMDRVIMEKSK